MNRVLSILFLSLLMGSVLGIAIIGSRMEMPVKPIESEQVKDLRQIIKEKDALIARQREIIADQQSRLARLEGHR